MGLEYDTNPLRLQSGDPRLRSDDPDLQFLDDEADVVARYFVRLRSTHRVARHGQVWLQVRHGGKLYTRTSPADTLLTEVRAGYRHRLGQSVSVGFDGDVKDRSERLSRLDYNRGGVGVGLWWQPGLWQLSGRVGWRYFAYKPLPALGSQGPRVGVHIRRYIGDILALDGSYRLARRGFDGQRVDTYHVVRTGVVYRGAVVAKASYVLSLNRSTVAAQQLTRHGLEMSVTAPLVAKFYGSTRVQLQRSITPQRSSPDALFFVDDGNRNVIVAALARPIGAHWEIEARWSLYLEQFSGAEGGFQGDYSRQTAILSGAWNF